MKLKVRVSYKNKLGQVVQECDYELRDYTDIMSMDMKRLISDIEAFGYACNGNKPKEDWSKEELVIFENIRRRLLDKAGELSRLPDGIYDGDDVKEASKPSSFWEKIFSE